jgi:hydrogenase maturation protease
MSMSSPLLILGLGNVLLRDDGVGSAAIAALQDGDEPPAGVSVLDGGTLGLSLLPYLEEASTVILVDAVQADAPPGTLLRLEGEDVGPAVATRLSPHQIGVADLLDGARWRDRYPSRLVLLGIVPESLDLHVGLSPRVAAALPRLVERVVDEARASGFEFSLRVDVADADDDRPAVDVARLAGLR